MKVLILSCSTGGGHNSAALAIQKELASRGVASEIKNALHFVPKAKRALIERGHTFMYRYAPELYSAAYTATEKKSDHHLLYLDYARYAVGLAVYITKNGFDTAVCVHEFPALMLTCARRTLKLGIRQYFVATDYTCSPGVEETEMDAWFVPAELAGEFSAHGLPPERIVEAGIPVDPDCYRAPGKAEARKHLGLRDDVPVFLISAGSIGCGPIGELALSLRNSGDGRACVAVLCGRNKALLRQLSDMERDALFLPLSFTGRVNEWIAASDLMFLKPGGLSSTEAATIGIPMVFLNAVPGLETHNLDYFLSHGCGITAGTVEELGGSSLRLLASPELAAGMVENQRSLFRRNAVAELAGFLQSDAPLPGA